MLSVFLWLLWGALIVHPLMNKVGDRQTSETVRGTYMRLLAAVV